MRNRSIAAAALVAIVAGLSFLTPSAHAQIAISVGTYTQTFDSMSTNVTGSSDYPANWTGNRLAGSGTIGAFLTATNIVPVPVASGLIYNRGTNGANPVTDRALGSLASGSTVPGFGAWFTNNTGLAITNLNVAFRSEQWRTGSTNAVNERLQFEISQNATNVYSPVATWTAVTNLDAIEILTATIASTNIDGNAVGNFVVRSNDVAIVIPPGGSFWIRWRDENEVGNDGLYAVDDFTLTATTGAPLEPITITVDPSSVLETNIAGVSANVSITNAPATNIFITLTHSPETNVTFSSNPVTITAGNTNATFTIFPVTNASYADFVVSLTASAPDYANGVGSLTVQNVDLAPISVVMNKYRNNGDALELLVVGNNTPGSSAVLTGMILKDFSGNMAADAGGRRQFTSNALWSNVLAGTLIVVDATSSAAADTNTPWVITVGLANTNFFTSLGDAVDIGTTDMVMVKAAGSGASGTNGNISTLSAGFPSDQYNATPGAKLNAAATTGNGQFAYAENNTGTLDDWTTGSAYSGSKANIFGEPLAFGSPNNASNAQYIAYLRGSVAGSGLAVAVITNASAGDYNNTRFFPRDSAVTVQMNFRGYVGATNPQEVIEVTVPAAFTNINSLVTLGAGFSGASATLSGQVITISNAALLASAPGELYFAAGTPPQNTLTSEPNYPFTVRSQAPGGSLTAIPVAPAALVIIPIENLRDLNGNGVSLDDNKAVAVEGVITSPSYNGFSQVKCYLQDDGGYGINVFSFDGSLTLPPTNRMVVSGTLTQINGLTEVEAFAQSDLLDLGLSTMPAPVELELTNLLANAERYESVLVKVLNMTTNVSNTNAWGPDLNLIWTQVGSGTNVIVRLDADMEVAYIPEPAYPVNVTAIFSQFDTSVPYTSAYQLLPRYTTDIEPYVAGSLTGFQSFQTNYFGSTTNLSAAFDADADGDGMNTLLEYAFNTDPTSPASFAQTAVGTNGGYLTIDVPRNSNATDITYWVQESTNLYDWLTVTSMNGTNPAPAGSTVTVSGTNLIVPGGRDNLRVKITLP